MRVSAVNYWHSEGWTLKNEALMEAVVKQARTTRHPWLVACDVHMNPEDFKQSLWFKEGCMFIEAPEEGVSTCRSKGPNGELIERTYDKNIGVVEDLESRPAMAQHNNQRFQHLSVPFLRSLSQCPWKLRFTATLRLIIGENRRIHERRAFPPNHEGVMSIWRTPGVSFSKSRISRNSCGTSCGTPISKTIS